MRAIILQEDRCLSGIPQISSDQQIMQRLDSVPVKLITSTIKSFTPSKTKVTLDILLHNLDICINIRSSCWI